MKQKDKFLLLMVLSLFAVRKMRLQSKQVQGCTLRLIKKYCRIRLDYGVVIDPNGEPIIGRHSNGERNYQ